MRTPRRLALPFVLALGLLLLLPARPALAGDDDAPPPAPQPGAVISGSAEAITLFIDEVPLRDVLGAIAKVADLNIMVAQDVEGTVSVRFRDMAPRQALEMLARMTGNRLVEEQYGILRFVHARESTAPPPKLPPREFQLRFYDVQDLVRGWPTLIADLREAFPKARFETRKDALVVTAPPGIHEAVEAWLEGVRLRLAARDAGAARVGRQGQTRSPFAIPPKPPTPPSRARMSAPPKSSAPLPPSALQAELRRLTEEVRQLHHEVRELRELLEARPPAQKRRPPQAPIEVDR